MPNDEQAIIAITKRWIQEVVIGLNFCPFAATPFEQQAIRYRVLPAPSTDDLLVALLDECQYLDTNPSTETTLIIWRDAFHDFEAYLMLVGAAEDVLEAEELEEAYQLASFHPDYCFVDADADDAANFTNRSPFPMIHILRTASVERAVNTHPDTEAIPETNINLARSKGSLEFEQILEDIRNTPIDEDLEK
ncbi:MAG: DUF1415 domain-containing protein [Phycisphaerae bacterium]